MKHKVTIKRSEWFRGNGALGSRLWIKAKQQGCCLGHAMHQVCQIRRESLSWGLPDLVSAPGSFKDLFVDPHPRFKDTRVIKSGCGKPLLSMIIKK